MRWRITFRWFPSRDRIRINKDKIMEAEHFRMAPVLVLTVRGKN
jgi:hypothetical protein